MAWGALCGQDEMVFRVMVGWERRRLNVSMQCVGRAPRHCCYGEFVPIGAYRGCRRGLLLFDAPIHGGKGMHSGSKAS